MGVYGGIEKNWAALTNTGRTHVATKGIVQSGLVLNLDAGVSSSYGGSGTTWTDLSGSGNTGTLVNGPTYSSANGGVIALDGTNDYVSLNSALNLSTNSGFTVCLFLNQNAAQINSVSWNYFYSRNAPQAEMGCFGNGPFVFKDNSTGAVVVSSNVASTWSYIAFGTVATTRTPFIYTFDSTGYTLNTTATAFSNTTLGFERLFTTGPSGGPSGTQYYRASCPIIQAYNKVLSASEISQNFLAMRARFGI